ncbi:MAG TPA: hypothetical protein PLE60_03640 [Candidatus Latescibacteria bacterium]|nr:hypothetical protein [Candidatus Latescibacterota bacterium]
MQLILVLCAATGLGWFIGSRPVLGRRLARSGHTVMLVAIALLLFAMGYSLGSRPDIIAQAGRLGVEAMSLALAGASGAVVSVWLSRRWSNARNTGQGQM